MGEKRCFLRNIFTKRCLAATIKNSAAGAAEFFIDIDIGKLLDTEFLADSLGKSILVNHNVHGLVADECL